MKKEVKKKIVKKPVKKSLAKKAVKKTVKKTPEKVSTTNVSVDGKSFKTLDEFSKFVSKKLKKKVVAFSLDKKIEDKDKNIVKEDIDVEKTIEEILGEKVLSKSENEEFKEISRRAIILRDDIIKEVKKNTNFSRDLGKTLAGCFDVLDRFIEKKAGKKLPFTPSEKASFFDVFLSMLCYPYGAGSLDVSITPKGRSKMS